MHIVELLLPVTNRSALRRVFEPLKQRLVDKFGGVTAFVRSPGDGVWESGEGAVRDDIVIVEVMTEQLDHAWWRALRAELEQQLDQDEIVVRAHTIEKL